MKRIVLIVLLGLSLFSCKKTEEEEEKKKYDLYQPSEMAALMEYMYEFNRQVKENIVSGKNLGSFSNEFFKIYTAKLTDKFERDENFTKYAKLYLDAEMNIFNPVLTIPVEDRFNKMVNLCISCHQTSCTGPIPRIEKLLIP